MDWQIIVDSLPRFWTGLVITVQITAISVVLGLILAVPLALMRVAASPLLWMPAFGFAFFFRGTPLLVQLFLIYYGSGQFRDFWEAVGLWGFLREPWFCGVLALTLNTGAYTSEILRGAIQAVPHGEVEAAKACGMSRTLTMRRIILPKAARLALPAYSNEVVFLLQATSLVSLITILDITGVASRVAARSFDYYEMYLTAAALYLVLVYGVLWVFRRVEYRLSGHLRERPSEPAGATLR